MRNKIVSVSLVLAFACSGCSQEDNIDEKSGLKKIEETASVEKPIKVKEEKKEVEDKKALAPLDDGDQAWLETYSELAVKEREDFFNSENLYQYTSRVESYDTELEIQDLLVEYFKNERGMNVDEFHKKFSEEFSNALDRYIVKIEEEKIPLVDVMDRDYLQSYVDFHKVFSEAQRVHVKILQNAVIFGVLDKYRKSHGLDDFELTKYDEFEMDSNSGLETIRPFDDEASESISRLINRGEKLYSNGKAITLPKEIEQFELINFKRLDEQLQMTMDIQEDYVFNPEEESEPQNYWENFLTLEYDRNFYYGMKEELNELEKDVLPSLEADGDEKQFLRDYIDIHRLFNEAMHLYSVDYTAREVDESFIQYITNFLAASNDEAEGPYQDFKHFSQSEAPGITNQ